MRALQGKKVEPVFVAVTDLRAPGRKGNVQNALNFLKYHGLKLGMDDAGLMETLGLDEFDVTIGHQESTYLSAEDIRRYGPQGSASANLLGIHSARPLEKVFFKHPIFGRGNKQRSREVAKAKTGCDFCLWFIFMGNPKVPLNPVDVPGFGRVVSELTCTYDPRDPWASKSCPRFMSSLKHTFTRDSIEAGEVPYQYLNTPSCDNFGRNYTDRYWGPNYDRLLRIKRYWDPDNVFDHCQSVGSTMGDDCCAIN